MCTAAPGSTGTAPAAPVLMQHLHKLPPAESAERLSDSPQRVAVGLLGTRICASSCAQGGPSRIPCDGHQELAEFLCGFQSPKVSASFAKSH